MKKNTASADLNPQNIKIGKWEFPPLTINTAILLERIGSPFMRAPELDANGNPMKIVPTMEDFTRTLYVLVHQNDPRIHDIIADESKFRLCVSDMAREISFRELSNISAALNNLMSMADQAISESGLEGDGKKKEIGRLS